MVAPLLGAGAREILPARQPEMIRPQVPDTVVGGVRQTSNLLSWTGGAGRVTPHVVVGGLSLSGAGRPILAGHGS